MEINELTEQVIGAAIEVHRELGPGLLESAYRMCLVHELYLRGIQCRTEVDLPLQYKGVKLDCGYRVDVLVEDVLVLELKTVDQFAPIHDAQLLTCLRLGGWPVGLLLNFNVPVLKDGIRRKVLNLKEKQ